MKNDPSFKLVVAIVIVGVIVALISPSSSHASQDRSHVDQLTAPQGQ